MQKIKNPWADYDEDPKNLKKFFSRINTHYIWYSRLGEHIWIATVIVASIRTKTVVEKIPTLDILNYSLLSDSYSK